MRSIYRNIKPAQEEQTEVITEIAGHELEYEKVKNKKTLEQEKEERSMKVRKRTIRWILLTVAFALSDLIYYFTKSNWWSMLPILIHILLAFYSFAVEFYKKRKDAEYWKKYEAKYAVNGEIPEHVKMIHKKLIQNGEKISIN